MLKKTKNLVHRYSFIFFTITDICIREASETGPSKTPPTLEDLSQQGWEGIGKNRPVKIKVGTGTVLTFYSLMYRTYRTYITDLRYSFVFLKGGFDVFEVFLFVIELNIHFFMKEIPVPVLRIKKKQSSPMEEELFATPDVLRSVTGCLGAFISFLVVISFRIGT